MHSSHPRTYALALLAVAAAAPVATQATIIQETTVVFEDTAGTRTDDQDRTTTPPDALRTLLASIGAPQGDFFASGSVSEFGQLGLTGQHRVGGEMTAQVVISSDEFVNLFATPQRAVANFIVDGGSLAMLAGGSATDPAAAATLELVLTISSRIVGVPLTQRVWQSVIEMSGINFQTPSVSLRGEDLGAFVDPNNSTRVEIPFSFQTFDLGIVPPGGQLDIEYFLDIRSDVGAAEIVFFEFSDPLTLGAGAPAVTFSPVVAAAPEPSTLALLAALLLPLAGLRRAGV